MEKRVLVDTFQKVTQQDFLKMGLFPEQSMDTIVGKMLIPDKAYSGFPVVQSAPAEITIGRGWLMSEGKIFFNDTDGGQSIDLLQRLPSATRKIVAVTTWGQEIDSRLEPRTFLVNAETRATEARETSTEHWRWANLGIVSGVEGPDPQPPAVAADVLTIAHVLLSPTGIVSITMVEENRVPTLRGVDNEVNELNIWRLVIGSRLDTLASDLLNLASKIFGLARFDFVRRVTADVARIKEQLKLPDAYTAYSADHFLTLSGSDTAHIDWLARVEEGVRFPPEETRDDQLGLLNPFDPTVINTNFVLLPKFSYYPLYGQDAADGEVSILQYQYQTVNMVQKTMTRTRVRYGTPFSVCTNSEFWQTGEFDYQEWTFKKGSEVFEIIGALDLALIIGGVPHQTFRFRQVWTDTVEEPYWERLVQNYSVSGAIIAQTVAISQDGWLGRIRVPFYSLGATGDVTMLITETTNGAPDPKRVLARSTVAYADLKTAIVATGQWLERHVPFVFQPVYLRKGRYAIMFVTTGDHHIWISKNRNLYSGTFFTSTDGEWFQGDLVTDINMHMDFCLFENGMSVVQLQPLQLSGGIAAIDILADSIVPPGSQLIYQVQVGGFWRSLDLNNPPESIFTTVPGLPPLLPFRAVFIGTGWIQPALGVASNSRVTTWRPRPDFRHISTIRTMPAPVTTVTVDIRLENWRGTPFQTFICKLLHGASYGTVRNPDVTVEEIAPDDPSGDTVIRHYTFTGMGAISTFRFRFEGTTDNRLATFHVAERLDVDT